MRLTTCSLYTCINNFGTYIGKKALTDNLNLSNGSRYFSSIAVSQLKREQFYNCYQHSEEVLFKTFQ